MLPEYATVMWSDAGVGVAAQQIIMKYFLYCSRYNFTAAEASISHLAVDSVPPTSHWYSIDGPHS
jgi:hypothetical protein